MTDFFVSVLDEQWEACVNDSLQAPRVVSDKDSSYGPILSGGRFWMPGAPSVRQAGQAERVQLAALAPEMARTLLALEYVDSGACPECVYASIDGHDPTCKLGAVCDKLRAIAKASR